MDATDVERAGRWATIFVVDRWNHRARTAGQRL